MPSRRRAFIAPLALLLGLALVSLGGCTYDEGGPPDAHFEDFAAKPPKRDTVTVCHAYGCKAQTKFTFTESDITELRALMAGVDRGIRPNSTASTKRPTPRATSSSSTTTGSSSITKLTGRSPRTASRAGPIGLR